MANKMIKTKVTRGLPDSNCHNPEL